MSLYGRILFQTHTKFSAYMMQKVLKENAVVTFRFCLEVALLA